MPFRRKIGLDLFRHQTDKPVLIEIPVRKPKTMQSLAATSLSGMNAAQARLHTSAHNIANSNTEGFRRQEVSQTSQPDGGVSTQVVQQNTVGSALAADLVQQLEAKNAFLANLAVFKRSDQMMGSLLDTRS